MKIFILLAACFVAAASGNVVLFEFTKEKLDDPPSAVGNVYFFGPLAKSKFMSSGTGSGYENILNLW